MDPFWGNNLLTRVLIVRCISQAFIHSDPERIRIYLQQVPIKKHVQIRSQKYAVVCLICMAAEVGDNVSGFQHRPHRPLRNSASARVSLQRFLTKCAAALASNNLRVYSPPSILEW